MARLVVLVCLTIGFGDQSSLKRTGLAHNENFVVTAPSQELAYQVLERAELLRKEIAQEWLGEELPPSVGPASITVTLSDTANEGHTWVIDDPSRHYHLVWITTSHDKISSSALPHEIVHVVFATQFSDALPTWALEGAACLHDAEERLAKRRRTMEWMARTKNWPDLQSLLDARSFLATDHAAYSVAMSLTEFFLEFGGKTKFLDFSRAGKAEGWDTALQRAYGIRSVTELQTKWQYWVVESARRKLVPTDPPSQMGRATPTPKSSPLRTDPNASVRSAAAGF